MQTRVCTSSESASRTYVAQGDIVVALGHDTVSGPPARIASASCRLSRFRRPRSRPRPPHTNVAMPKCCRAPAVRFSDARNITHFGSAPCPGGSPRPSLDSGFGTPSRARRGSRRAGAQRTVYLARPSSERTYLPKIDEVGEPVPTRDARRSRGLPPILPGPLRDDPGVRLRRCADLSVREAEERCWDGWPSLSGEGADGVFRI